MTIATLLLACFLPQEESIEDLVDKLGSSQLVQREDAMEELLRRGSAAMKKLVDAKNEARDPEKQKPYQNALESILGRTLRTGVVKESRVTLSRPQGPVSEWVKTLSRTTKIRIEIDGDMDMEVPAVGFQDAKLPDVLTQLTRLLGGFWMVEKDRVLIVLPSGEPTRIFDVRDLTMYMRDEPALPMKPDGPTPGIDDDDGNEISGEDVSELIQVTVDPDSWEDGDRSIQFENGMLIVQNAPVTIAKVEAHLRKLRRKFLMNVRLDIEAFAVKPGTKVDEKSVEQLRRAAREGKTARLVASFSRTVRDKRRAACASLTRTLLLTEYDEDGDPLLREYSTGVKINLTPSFNGDRSGVRIELEAGFSKLLKVEIKKGDRGELQVPTFANHVLRSTISVPAGRTSVLGRLGETRIEDGLGEIILVGRFTKVDPK